MPNWYKETEQMINRYWQRKMQIERLEAKRDRIMAAIRHIQREIGTVREGRGLRNIIALYGAEKVQTSGGRGLDDELINIGEKVRVLLRRLTKKQRELARINARIDRLREENAPMETVMKRLSKEEYALTEMRYVYRWSTYDIADELNWSQPTIHRMKDRVIRKVAEWLGKVDPEAELKVN